MLHKPSIQLPISNYNHQIHQSPKFLQFHQIERNELVYLTAHTWNDRGIPDKCTDSDNEKFHAIMVSKLENIFVWHFGDYPM